MTNSCFIHCLLGAASGIALLSATGAVFAADNAPGQGGTAIETVIVTANKRVENVQEIPQSVEVFSTQRLQDAGAQDFADLVPLLPGVEFRNPQPGKGSVAIRGISELNRALEFGGTGGNTGLYLDELPFTSAGFFPQINAFDLQRIEVLKGPQGTLFGEGALAGVVRLVTNKPDTNKFGAAIDSEYFGTDGGAESYNVNAMVNVPIIEDKLAFRVVGFSNDEGGYLNTRINSTGIIDKNTNFDKNFGGRADLRFTSIEKLTIDINAYVSSASRGETNRAAPNFIDTHSVLEATKDKIQAYNLTADYDLGFADLVSTSSYIHRGIDQLADNIGLVASDNMILGLFHVPITITGAFSQENEHSKAFSQEVRLVSSTPGPLKWTVGIFYKNIDYSSLLNGETTPVIPASVYQAMTLGLTGGHASSSTGLYTLSEKSTAQIAGFGELSYDVTPRFQLLAGLRAFQENRTANFYTDGLIFYLEGASAQNFATKGTSRVLDPRFTATYHLNDTALVYATFSKGFRSGGQNDFYQLVHGSTPIYKPETLSNYEVGLKSSLLEGRVVLNGSFFYLNWHDLQAQTGNDPYNLVQTVGNIGKAHSMGVEADVTWLTPIHGLTLDGSVSLLDAHTDSDTPTQYNGAPIVVPKGARIPNTARASFNLEGAYRFPLTNELGGFVRASDSYKGDSVSYLYSNAALGGGGTAPNFSAPSSNRVDLKIGVEAGKWQLYVFSDNVTNAKIIDYQENFADFGSGLNQYYYERPRTVGIKLIATY